MLQRAYSGAYWLIPSTVGCALVLLTVPDHSGNHFPIWEVVILAMTFLLNFTVALTVTSVIADCRGGKRGEAIWVSAVAAFGSLLCFGIVGTAVIQAAVTREVRKYGIKPRFFGIAGEDFAAKIEELAEAERPS